MKTIKKAAALLLLFILTAGGWFYRADDGSAPLVEQVVHTNTTQTAPATVLLQPQPASAVEHATTGLCKVTTPELQLQQLMASQHQLRFQPTSVNTKRRAVISNRIFLFNATAAQLPSCFMPWTNKHTPWRNSHHN